jgi:hypothetical protein
MQLPPPPLGQQFGWKGRLGQGRPIIQAVALSLPTAACHCHTWRWLVVVSSAKQKQQRHHQQLTIGITILKTFTFPENWTYPFGRKPPKAWEPLSWTDQPTTNQPTTSRLSNYRGIKIQPQ